MVNCFVFTASGKCDNRVRLFAFLSTEGPFLAKEILNQTRSDHVSPYPFRQAILYDATQPGNTMFCGVNVRLYAYHVQGEPKYCNCSPSTISMNLQKLMCWPIWIHIYLFFSVVPFWSRAWNVSLAGVVAWQFRGIWVCNHYWISGISLAQR